MPNIFDYLEWRGDLPFSADPFNEVDNIILSELAYTYFDRLVPEDGTQVPLTEVRGRFFRLHSRGRLKKSDSHLVRAPLLMDGMVSGERFRGMMLSFYTDIVDTDSDMQMSAVTYSLSDGSIFIAFRGTDDTIAGWKEDFNMSYLPETGGQRKAIEYLNHVGAAVNAPIRVGGHSKGGNFAVYASAFADSSVRHKIREVYTNDGPGFREEIMETDEYKSIVPKVISIVPDTSIIGMLLTSNVRHRVVKSSGKGFAQHDPTTWEVMGNRLVEAESSDLGIFIRDTQKDWLSKLDDRSRRIFVDTLFALFESTGKGTFGAIGESKLKSIERILSTATGLPRELQRELADILKKFIQSGGQNVKEWYSRMRTDDDADE